MRASEMKNAGWMIALVLLVGCAAQPAPEERDEGRVGSVEQQLYSAELVMDHQATIGLDEAQTSAIRGELGRTQAELVEAEWALRREREALATLLANERVDEAAALEAAGRVIEREGAIKLLHLRLLVRIKNQLTPEQQQRLEQLRRR